MSAVGVMPALFAEHERFGCWWLDVAVNSGLSCSAHDLGVLAPSGSAAFESRMITSISSNRFFRLLYIRFQPIRGSGGRSGFLTCLTL